MRTLVTRSLIAAAVAATFAAMAAPAAANHDSATRWAPFDLGNRWVLRDPASGASREIRVDQSYGSLRYVAGLFGRDLWVGYSASSRNTLWTWNADARRWQGTFRFGVRSPRTTWRFALGGGCGDFGARWAASGETVQTPAGTFTGCRRLSVQLRPAPNVRCAAPDTDLWFARGVGIVKIADARGQTFELESAIVGNDVYPQPAQPPAQPISSAATLDKQQYVNQPNTIRCITTPCPSNEVTDSAKVTFTVTNNTTSTKKFEFSSGQQFDFEILDQGGQVVKAWSDGRYFTMALTQFDLAPGRSMTFRGDLELKDRNERQLDGTYTVRARLTTAGWSQQATAPVATAQLNVVVR